MSNRDACEGVDIGGARSLIESAHLVRHQPCADLCRAFGADQGVPVFFACAHRDETLTSGSASGPFKPKTPGEGGELIAREERDLDPVAAVEVAAVLDDPSGDDFDSTVADPVALLRAVIVEVNAHDLVVRSCKSTPRRTELTTFDESTLFAAPDHGTQCPNL